MKRGEEMIRFFRGSESSLYVYLGEKISAAVNKKVYALKNILEKDPPGGIKEIIPAYHSILLSFDPALFSHEAAEKWILSHQEETEKTAETQEEILEIPVCYDPEFGRDLSLIASLEGKSIPEVISMHRDADYRNYLTGFAPGQPYLGRNKNPYSFGRRESPRMMVPAGSVVVQKDLCCILPIDSPCGWNLIGRTPLTLFQPDRPDPFLLKPGQTVRFREISKEEYLLLSSKTPQAPEKHEEKPEKFMKVLRPGLLTTVQDLGITGMESQGISPSGAMDKNALTLANLLVGNAPDSACLEITLQGPGLRFSCQTVIAVCGGDFPIKQNEKDVPMNTALSVKAGDVLDIGACRQGCRCYLAISGGLDLPLCLGSRSTSLKLGMGGYAGRKLQTGDCLALAHDLDSRPPSFGKTVPYFSSGSRKIRVLPGPQQELFSEEGLQTFFQTAYTLSPASNRQGCRLSGKAVSFKNNSNIISEGILTGAIQIPPDGQPIIMTAERQTCGGYPKIGTVIEADLPLLAQAKPGDALRFEPCDMETAIAARAAREEFQEKISAWLKISDGFAPKAALESYSYACEIIEGE